MLLLNQARLADAEQGARALLRLYPNSGMLWKILSVALVRQDKDAFKALGKAAELLPEDAEVHSNLGAALHDRRHWGEALVSLRRALALDPKQVQALIDAGNSLCRLGRARESVEFYHRALELEPGSTEAHNNLGNAFLELGTPVEALPCYRRALELHPDNAEVRCNLANALRQLGRLEEAVAESERAIALDERLAMAHNNLGLCLAGLGQRERALACYRTALVHDPRYVEALSNLGDTLHELGRRHEALEAHSQAVQIDSRRADSHVNLGKAQFELRHLREAEASLRRALTLDPGHAKARLHLAATLRMLERTEEAEAVCRALLAQDPQSVEALTLLAELAADRGRFTEAQELLQRALALDPDRSATYCGIAAHRRMTEADQTWLGGVQALLARPLPLGHQINLHYALGKYFDDLKRYDEAFASYRQANELSKRYGLQYDRAKLEQRVNQLITHFDAAAMRRRWLGAADSELPIFIVGMPRSGTSLAEQILASHPAVFGAGELRFWNGAFGALEKAGLGSEAGERLMAQLGPDYLDQVSALAGGKARLTDKMPANFMYAGLIHAVLPRARIIHMQRDPLDTCLSIYFQSFFNLMPYDTDFDSLAHFYGEYRRIMAHWREVLPSTTLLEIPYESLIEEPEAWTRRMLDFVGLPWDPVCLEFHRTARVVLTASKWQVRQTLHRGSIGRWRNYEKHLAPLRRMLGRNAETAEG